MREYRPRIGFRNIRHNDVNTEIREDFSTDLKAKTKQDKVLRKQFELKASLYYSLGLETRQKQ